MTLNNFEDNIISNVLPGGMQNCGLVVQDEENNSVIKDLDQLSIASEKNIAPAVITIENSTDVIIGPVTQFHGPVTIYQNASGVPAIEVTKKNTIKYPNGKLVKSESSASETSHTSEKNNQSFFLCSKHLKYIGIPIVLIILIVIITCAIILTSKSEKRKPDREQFSTTNISEDNGTLTLGTSTADTFIPIGSGSLINRAEWNAISVSNSSVSLKHPTPLVVIAHTASSYCRTFTDCSKKVANIQAYHINQLNFPDISYNFLIGGDANVYVGRGWHIQNNIADNSISISFIGNYVTGELTNDMIKTAIALINEGVTTKKLAEDYKVVCHNQTSATQSPGRNVYKVVKTWPHFDPRSYKRRT